MNSYLYADYCFLWGLASNFNLQTKAVYRQSLTPYNHWSLQFVHQLSQSIALGALGLLTYNKILNSKLILSPSIFLPMTIVCLTKGLSYIAYRSNRHVDEMEKLNKNIEVYIDKLNRISSIALLILLAPECYKAPVSFCFGATVAIVNTIY